MTTYELYAKIIAESELLQPALNEIHKFCFQHWSRGRGTSGTSSDTPVDPMLYVPEQSYCSFPPPFSNVLLTHRNQIISKNKNLHPKWKEKTYTNE